MKNLVSPALEKYALDHTAAEHPLLAELAAETRKKTDYPQMMIGPVEGGLLRFLVRALNAHRALEIGTFTGYSSLCIAEGLPSDGRLITLDNDPKATAIAKRYWQRSEHGRKIHLIVGEALESLKSIEGSLDFAFIDADKENYARYWEVCVPKLRSGGVIVTDNVLWSGKVLKPKDKTDKAIAAFNDLVLSDKRMESVMLTVRDGMTVSFKR